MTWTGIPGSGDVGLDGNVTFLPDATFDIGASATNRPRNLFLGGYAEIKGPRPWIDVRAYGAKGDGVTDDTAAIQAVEDSLTSDGVDVLLPAGTYLVSGIVVGKNYSHTFRGVGNASTIIKLKNGSNQWVIRDRITSGFATTVGPRVEFRDLQVDGNRANQTDTTKGGIWGYAGHRFSNILITGTKGDGLRMGNDGTLIGITGTSQQWSFYYSQIGNASGRALAIRTSAGDAIIQGNRFQQEATAGECLFATAGGLTIVGNEFNNGIPAALNLNGPFGAGEIIASNNFVGFPQHGIQLIGSAGAGGEDSNIQIVGNNILADTLDTNNLYSGIRVVNQNAGSPTRFIYVIGNTIHKTSGSVNKLARGIELTNTGGALSDVQVAGNTIGASVWQTAAIVAQGSSIASLNVFGNQGYNGMQATSLVTAGASVWTYTNNDGYPEFMTCITNPANISALSWKGQALVYSATAPPTLLLQPGDTMAVTWATAAPVFYKVPQ